ncbi:hypothetical protein KP509_08G001100 [Ceratopteris richardii]|uniref:non-specific serine/threonine protein kinase n=1 Tax=Ceratopteris richardii TaxID=49495 RepID=A0A8T2U579_CERRI|nr:hypothetical protein KP509_08G001100 [Ceratopteris richardii]
MRSAFRNVVCQTHVSNFSYNGFGSTEARSQITCYQSASFQGNNLQLTETGAVQASGRCLYNQPIQLLDPNTRTPRSFSTQFIFFIRPSTNSDLADGIAFVIAPALGAVNGSNQGYIGIFNNETNGRASTRTLAVEFDTYKNPEHDDMDDNHVGVDVNDIVSYTATSAAYRTSSSPTIQNANDGYTVHMKNAAVQAWIDFNGSTNQLNISVSRTLGVKPMYPLISNSSLNLSSLFDEYMYVGFSASTGPLPTVLYYVYAWSFTNNGSLAANVSMVAENTGNGTNKRVIIIGALLGIFGVVLAALVLLLYYRKKVLKPKYRSQDQWRLALQEHLPQEFSYRELARATSNFNEKNRLGSGGFGEVFRGTIVASGVEIAVKRISNESKQGVKEFVAEVTTIGRLRHRNLVPLLGWSQEKGLLLVYELMPHGSLDQVLFNHPEQLPWEQRLHIISGVAAALLYLHEECEQKIIHRDVKASNVMLDAQMNARLGDFGLARLHGHNAAPSTTNVAGTWGYMAPESFFTRKATEQTDVFSFGVLILEVVTGRKVGMIEEENCSMLEWLWALQKNDTLADAIDPFLVMADQGAADMMKIVLQLGILCCFPDPKVRPLMRRIVQILNGEASSLPTIPSVTSSFSLLSSVPSAPFSYSETTASAPNHSMNSISLDVEGFLV